ncbi:alpha/beta fold hydrolase [Leptobacterium sp. I13]|uniref:alpha/beta fold hydrolase n=1 Tax=Leptobacterium meishanense TaxID=3128904 RepID=UPI0030EC7FBE
MQLLHSNIIGEGLPLIILHGFLGMSDNWKTLGNSYAENGFQVHLIDQRNHGRSFHSNEFSYEVMADDLLYYMQHYNINTSHIIGHSMGGKTAMFFATSYPENVSKLLIADIAPKYYPVHHQTILEGLNAIDCNSVNNRSEAEEQLAKYIPELGVRQFLLKSLYRKTPSQFAFRFNLKVLTATIKSLGKALSSTAHYSGPTLFLKGGKSNYIAPEDETIIKYHFPKAAIATIENAGHWLHAENPEQFFKLSFDFLRA